MEIESTSWGTRRRAGRYAQMAAALGMRDGVYLSSELFDNQARQEENPATVSWIVNIQAWHRNSHSIGAEGQDLRRDPELISYTPAQKNKRSAKVQKI